MAMQSSPDNPSTNSGQALRDNRLCLPSHLSPPPAGSDEEESPVGEEFGSFALEGMSQELEYPAEEEESGGVR